jgi:hypothetical protein
MDEKRKYSFTTSKVNWVRGELPWLPLSGLGFCPNK